VPLFVAALPIFSRSYLCSPSVRRNHARSTAPVARGQNNFDTVRYEYYRDREVAFEGFTARGYLFREEFRSWPNPSETGGTPSPADRAQNPPMGAGVATGEVATARREELRAGAIHPKFDVGST
jgi:hypothetical protein